MAGTRRAVLMTGGAAILIAGAGAAGWALTRAPARALEPWDAAAEGFGDPRLDALAYAILAPNPHNMQPWRIRLDGADAFFLDPDLSRMLPATDPPNRQIVIGYGAFLELFRQAAAQKGRRAEIELFPEGAGEPVLDERPIARVRLVEDAATTPDPLFGEALRRRTNRQPFEDRAVDPADLERIKAASAPEVFADATIAPDRLDELKAIARESWRIEWTTARTRRETIDVTRIGRREIEAAPWGILLSGPLLEGLGAAGLLTREKMDLAGEAAYEQALSSYIAGIDTARAFLWSTTPTNSRADQIEAGRAWARMHLAASAAGLAFQPLSQALQEFPEMDAPYRRIHGLLAAGGGIVQMFVRLGYAKAPPPTPREALAARLVAA